MGAKLLKIEELKLEKSEAEALGTAAANVARHYQWTGLAEKTKDWLTLAGISVMVYHPRLERARARVQAARKSRMAGVANPAGGIKMSEPPPVEIHIEGAQVFRSEEPDVEATQEAVQ